jgi:hypothetical protein
MIFGEPGRNSLCKGFSHAFWTKLKPHLPFLTSPSLRSEGEAVSIFFNSLSWSPASFVCAATRLIAK